MKYLKLFLTLIFAVFAAVFYLSNSWLSEAATVSFGKIPPQIYAAPELPPVPVWTVVASAFLLGIVFTLIHSSLNWLELIGKNRKIKKLEGEMTDGESEQS